MDAYKTEVYRGWLIKIDYDNDAESPREWDNVCTMKCYHRNYCLGDNGCKGDPYEDLRKIIIKEVDPKEFIEIVNENCSSIRIDLNEQSWSLYENYNGEWYLDNDYCFSELDCLFDRAVGLLDDGELFTVVYYSSTVAISHIYAYIHGGITISMSRGGQFSDQFDSGCLGWIYVTKKKMMSEFSNLTDETWKQKAYDVMESEVETYDAYLTGECFGWSVHAPIEGSTDEWEDWPEDSCCGYIGTNEIDYMISETKGEIDCLIKQAEEKEAKAQAILTEHRDFIANNLAKIIGYRFISCDNLYVVNRNNLMELPQLEMFPTVNGVVSYVGTPVDISLLGERVVNTIYNAIPQYRNERYR